MLPFRPRAGRREFYRGNVRATSSEGRESDDDGKKDSVPHYSRELLHDLVDDLADDQLDEAGQLLTELLKDRPRGMTAKDWEDVQRRKQAREEN